MLVFVSDPPTSVKRGTRLASVGNGTRSDGTVITGTGAGVVGIGQLGTGTVGYGLVGDSVRLGDISGVVGPGDISGAVGLGVARGCDSVDDGVLLGATGEIVAVMGTGCVMLGSISVQYQ